MPLMSPQSGYGSARRIAFVALLVVALALATVYGREGEGGPLHMAQNGVMGVTGGAGAISSGLGVATGAIGDTVDDVAANENSITALREQNAELRRLLADADEYRQEAQRLQELLDMKKASGVTGPVANIIGRSTNAWDQSITINLGSEDGVESGMTIMGAYGVIGQVSRTQAHTSTVRLLTDPNSGAAVMIQSTRDDGIVRGSMNGLLYLEDLDEDVIPEVGDVILTSGLGGSYERGLIVGAVVSVNKTTSNTAGSIIVSPNDRASMLEEVIVVFSAPDVAAVEKAKEEAEAAKAAEEAAAQEAAEQEYLESIYGEDYYSTDYGYGTDYGTDYTYGQTY